MKSGPRAVRRFVDAGFSKRLREAMGELNDAELARKVGATRAMIGQLLNGKIKNPGALLIFAIADALEVPPRWLLLGLEERPRKEVAPAPPIRRSPVRV